MTQTDDVTRAHAAMQCPEDLATRSKHQKEKQVCVFVCIPERKPAPNTYFRNPWPRELAKRND